MRGVELKFGIPFSGHPQQQGCCRAGAPETDGGAAGKPVRGGKPRNGVCVCVCVSLPKYKRGVSLPKYKGLKYLRLFFSRGHGIDVPALKVGRFWFLENQVFRQWSGAAVHVLCSHMRAYARAVHDIFSFFSLESHVLKLFEACADSMRNTDFTHEHLRPEFVKCDRAWPSFTVPLLRTLVAVMLILVEHGASKTDLNPQSLTSDSLKTN